MALKDSIICRECPLRERPGVLPDEGMEPDILFVGSYPMAQECGRGAFTDRAGGMLRKIVASLQRRQTAAERVVPAWAYAVMCSPPFDEATRKFQVCVEDVDRCSVHLTTRIDRIRPKVLVALGEHAMRALGLQGLVRDMRGGVYRFRLKDGSEIPLVATHSTARVLKAPGLAGTLRKDVGKAFTLAGNGFAEVPMDIRTPKTVDGILAALDGILAAAKARMLESGKPLAVAVDTETTSLAPHDPAERVIAVSMSHEDGVGLAYPFEHGACPFSPEDFARIREKTGEVLGSPDVALIMANGKFDEQWLRLHYGLPMHEMAYDVILAEHCLDEDKKGEYSLKDLVKDRFPAMGRYENELRDHLASVWKAKDDKRADLVARHRDACNAAILDWWTGLEDDGERQRLLAAWVTAGHVPLSDVGDLHRVRRRKLHGAMVVPKKYAEAVARFVRHVPPEALAEHIDFPELVIPPELERHTYEDADLDTLLRYAAIDALSTRLCCRDQRADFAADAQRMERAEAAVGRPLTSPSCYAAMASLTTPLSSVLADMEFHGIRLDRDKTSAYREVIARRMASCEDAMFTEVGRRFNTSSSSPDLAAILYGERKLPILKRTETGAPSTDADTIRELLDEHDDMNFLKELLVYRKLEKCLRTYIDNWLEMSARDGRIHCQFNQIGTSTHRLSSSNPNLQNVPFQLKEADLNIKELFLPDSEEYELYDLEHIEVAKPRENGGHPNATQWAIPC